MSSNKAIAIIAILLIFSLAGCTDDQDELPRPEASPDPPVAAAAKTGCRACHVYRLDEGHAPLACPTCHGGNNESGVAATGHLGLIPHPSSPANMEEKCGGCHQQTTSATTSQHFTLNNAINLVRRHFGADHDLANLQEIPVVEPPTTPLQLADDLLRRRCLRCHVFYEGDEYTKVRHGTGCAACHLEYRNGELVSHEFIARPTDNQCLSCHYGNRVGSDYYGRFDHDFKQEYRTPYQPDGDYAPRPYAVEQHNLSPDIHQQAGMACIDCHLTLHAGKSMTTIGCSTCHRVKGGQPLPTGNLRRESGKLVLTTRQNGLKLTVPPAVHPVHRQYQDKAACVVCHARWSYNDQSTQLLRIDHDDYGEWDELFVQDSAEVEVLLLNAIYGDSDVPPVMTDKVTGRKRPGIWLKGFEIRRWESPIIAPDRQGRLQVMRPILDLHLSWVDEEGETGFDSISGAGSGLRPYTPHTIGKAGAFFGQRLVKTNQPTTPEKQREP